MKKKEEQAQISLKVDKRDLENLAKIAKDNDRSRNAELRRLIHEYVSKSMREKGLF